MSRPLVSIVLPTYNRRALLEAAVDSVLTQTLGDFELFIIDDASIDGTAEMLAARARGWGRLALAIAQWPGNPRAARYICRRTFARQR